MCVRHPFIVYKIRAIDFDQQCYEGSFKVYRPQFFKENFPIIKLVKNRLNHDSVIQYKIEERSIVAKRIISSGSRLETLVEIMTKDTLSKPEYLKNLSQEIYKFTKDMSFKKVKTMGDVMSASFSYVRNNYENLNMSNLINKSNFWLVKVSVLTFFKLEPISNNYLFILFILMIDR